MGRIKTDRELAVSKKKVQEFSQSINETEEKMREKGIAKRQITMVIASQQSFVEQIKEEIAEYESLRQGVIPEALKNPQTASSFGDSLIAHRIARGLSQTDLAKKLGVKPSSICRDERNEYYGSSLQKIFDICQILKINLHINKS